MVAALLVWALSVNVFPDASPQLSSHAHVAMAVAATVLFFASILLHELGHAVVARHEGLTIDGVTLWLFGGVARFTGTIASPGVEFRVAAAGPFVTLLVGGAALLTAELEPLPDAVHEVVAWLGYINVTLLVFNLLPALPLDGGRMLRATVWRSDRDEERATRITATTGRGLALLLVALGLGLLLLRSSVTGVWIALVGWYLLGTGEQEARVLVVRSRLARLRVRDLMSPLPAALPAPGMAPVGPDDGALDALDELVTGVATERLVVEDGTPVGVLRIDDVARVIDGEGDRR